MKKRKWSNGTPKRGLPNVGSNKAHVEIKPQAKKPWYCKILKIFVTDPQKCECGKKNL